MATKGTPNGGLDVIADRVYISGADYTLVAYTNAADSLGPSTVTADLVEPTIADGYVQILLDGTWASVNGVLSYTHSVPSNPKWSATAAWSGTVNGVAIISGANVIHFMDLASPFVAAAGKTLAVDLDTVVA